MSHEAERLYRKNVLRTSHNKEAYHERKVLQSK